MDSEHDRRNLENVWVSQHFLNDTERYFCFQRGAITEGRKDRKYNYLDATETDNHKFGDKSLK